ncbi:hypothetical protein CHARACLAT_005723, partial [Characodon lateralis]|nr:hypothetical protein [Characodon lateralis]
MGTKRIGRVGERDAGFHSNGALPSALSCCHYGSEVFRSCRKQSYDSETTEDETTEPQMETKEGPGRHQDKAGRKGLSGDGGRLMDYNPDASDRRATLPGTYDPVVERELRTLGSRPPGPYLDPTNPARNKTAEESWGLSSHVPPPSTQPTLSKSLDKDKTEDPQASKISGTCDVIITPKLACAGPKIFDKVRAFEERRKSVDLSGGAASVDSDDSGKKTGGPSKEEGRILQGVAQKRAAFQHRASSLEDKTTYSQRVQSYQNKFAEELQRIKKLVGKSSLKKAYSTEQLSQKERIHTGKIEPIPQHVVRKLESRERALEDEGKAGGMERDHTSQVPPQVPGGPLGYQSKNPHGNNVARTAKGSSQESSGKSSVTMETAPVQQLPGQPLATSTKKGLISETLRSSPAADKHTLLPTSFKSSSSFRDLGKDPKRELKSHQGSPSPTGKRSSPVTAKQPSSQYPPKPIRPTPTLPPPVSPLLKKRRPEVGRVSPVLKVNIPTILVEDKPMEDEGPTDESKRKPESRRREGRVHKSKKGHSRNPRSPGEGGSSDDSYLSADEEPGEGPKFVKPLQDITAPTGSEVKLHCIITGRPAPTVTWRKNNVELRSDAFYNVKTEGEVHTLLIKELRPHNAGSYCVTAANTAGISSCSGTLYIRSEPSHMQCGEPAVSVEVSSPVLSDEEYLSPQEEEMEVGDSPSLHKDVSFHEPLSFQ